MPRFVILHHQLPEPPVASDNSSSDASACRSRRASHWDLMLEWYEGEHSLRTWALDEVLRPGASVAARQLAPHRHLYLDYEGPVSGDRGVVARWDHGWFEIERQDDERIEIELQGLRVRGQLRLQRQADDHWRAMWLSWDEE